MKIFINKTKIYRLAEPIIFVSELLRFIYEVQI